MFRTRFKSSNGHSGFPLLLLHQPSEYAATVMLGIKFFTYLIAGFFPSKKTTKTTKHRCQTPVNLLIYLTFWARVGLSRPALGAALPSLCAYRTSKVTLNMDHYTFSPGTMAAFLCNRANRLGNAGSLSCTLFCVQPEGTVYAALFF